MTETAPEVVLRQSRTRPAPLARTITGVAGGDRGRGTRGLWVLIAICAPLLTAYHPNAQDFSALADPTPGGWGASHWLGTERVGDLLEMVRLPRAFARRKPRQLSGGQKQRIAVARAFAGNPAMVIADEPVSALDVSVQAAIINLLIEVQDRHRTTMLFISHDLGVVRYLSDSIVVMYLGQVMEYGSAEEVLEPPYHPYTEALLSAVSVPDPRVEQKRIRLEGEIPSALTPPPGCRFATRCSRRIGEICDTEPPPVQETGSGHRIRCHIPMEALGEVEPVIGVTSRRRGNRRG